MPSFSKRMGSLVVTLAFLALALLLLAESYSEDYHLSRASTAMGPAFFPRIVLFLILGLGVLVIAQTIRQGKEMADTSGMARVLGLAALTVIYGIAMDWIGFVFASIPYVIATAVLLGYRRWQWVVPVSVLYAFAVWFLFQKVLLIILPASPWFQF